MPEITLIILKQLSLGGMYCPIIQDERNAGSIYDWHRKYETWADKKIIAGTSCLHVITMKCQYFSYIQCFVSLLTFIYLLYSKYVKARRLRYIVHVARMIFLLAWFLFSRTQCIPASWHRQCYQVSLFRRLLTYNNNIISLYTTLVYICFKRFQAPWFPKFLTCS